MTFSYRVLFSRDPETKSVVAEIPALGIADHGPTCRRLWIASATCSPSTWRAFTRKASRSPGSVRGGRPVPPCEGAGTCRLGRCGPVKWSAGWNGRASGSPASAAAMPGTFIPTAEA